MRNKKEERRLQELCNELGIGNKDSFIHKMFENNPALIFIILVIIACIVGLCNDYINTL